MDCCLSIPGPISTSPVMLCIDLLCCCFLIRHRYNGCSDWTSSEFLFLPRILQKLVGWIKHSSQPVHKRAQLNLRHAAEESSHLDRWSPLSNSKVRPGFVNHQSINQSVSPSVNQFRAHRSFSRPTFFRSLCDYYDLNGV